MADTSPLRSIRALQTGLPAVVIGALAGTLSAVPAHAAETSVHGAMGAWQVPTVRPAAAPDQPRTYTVKPGDTVWAIAQRHRLRTADVLAWNRIGPSAIIHPGQKLRLTPPSSKPAKPSKPSESRTRDAATHTVVAGDTVWAIAHRNGTSVRAVLAANGLSPDSIIYPGQKLRLPGAPAPSPASAPMAPRTDLNPKQAENARMIIRIGRELGVPDRGIAIALATSMVESGLRNLDYGDRDSLGLFQQRPSTGWGTPADIRHRGNSIRAFYLGKGDATRGLLDIPGWRDMRFTDAAQAVQISAFPERYGRWEKQAYRWLAQHG